MKAVEGLPDARPEMKFSMMTGPRKYQDAVPNILEIDCTFTITDCFHE